MGPNLVIKCSSADVYFSQQAMQNNCNLSVQKLLNLPKYFKN